MKKIKTLIKSTRLGLNETQTQFGERFSVTGVAISLWESGKRNVPNRVIESCINDELTSHYLVCPKCLGVGTIKKVGGKKNEKETINMKIYTEVSKCSQCRKVIEEYSKNNRSRTVKSYTKVCILCFNQAIKQAKEQINEK